MNRRGILKSFVGATVLALAPHFPKAALPIKEGVGSEPQSAETIIHEWQSWEGMKVQYVLRGDRVFQRIDLSNV